MDRTAPAHLCQCKRKSSIRGAKKFSRLITRVDHLRAQHAALTRLLASRSVRFLVGVILKKIE